MAKKTPHVALLIETARSYGRGLLRGVRRYISEQGPWSVYMELRALDSQPPEWIEHWKGDGILVRTGNQAIVDAVVAANLPVVELRTSRLMPGYPFAGVDNRAVGKMVAEHFAAQGFRRFAVYGIDTEDFFEERCRNFVEAVAEMGFHCEVFNQDHGGEHPLDWEQQQLQLVKWIQQLPKPIGVLTCTDQLGFWFLDACKRANVAVPEEVAVVGCENDESLATMASPPMSSVQFHAERTGYEAAALLDRLMKGEPPPAEPTLIAPLGIVTRQSSDIVAVEDKEIAEVLRYVRIQAPLGLSVEEILRRFPFSRAALDQRMRDAIGRTTKAEIVRVQLERVKLLLAETELSLAQIADRAGFRHPQYMAELFKKRFGLTPGSFRANAQRH
ncbi:XylR family transcriptional regulator [Lacipirellula sp.]|uniref:XylR family transcriptional regulator n=1 Tax=Lacipirellula sp. TaxID=2691419 RepID=UPI003D0B8F23